MEPPPVSRTGVEDRVGWMREELHRVDRACVRLVEDVRGGTLMDVDEVKRRLIALDKLIEVRRDETVIWRAYLFPPRSRMGRLLFVFGEALIRAARRVG